MRRRFGIVIVAALLAICGGCGSEQGRSSPTGGRELDGSAVPTAPRGDSDDGGRFELFVLGIAQDGGLPHLGCSKECCREARESGRELYPASLGIHDREGGALLLIEATPAVEKQVALLQRMSGVEPQSRRPVDAVLLTHAHIGHYTGLMHFGREVASTDAIPVHATARLTRFLESDGPWGQLVSLDQIRPRPFEPGATIEPLPGLRVETLPVEHRQEYADTVAFRIHGPRRTVLFVPDIDRWGEAGLERLLDGVDVAYLDATFYDGRELPGRELSEIPHPPMTVTMERLAERARERPGSLRFLHLNHTNPALHDAQIADRVRERGFRIAERGERVGL